MMDPREDQAAGLRRMFRQAPPEVLAVVPCGSGATAWLADRLIARAAAGRRVLALDEWAVCGNLADALGVAPRFDLLQVVEGFVDVGVCQVEAGRGLAVMPVARLSRALGLDRILLQRTMACFSALQPLADEWVVHARPCDITALSPLALAAPRLLLAVDPATRAVTEAYATLKRLAQGADTFTLGLAMTGPMTPETRALAANLASVAKRQLGIELLRTEDPLDLLAVPPRTDMKAATQYVERLITLARQAGGMGRMPAR